MASNYVDVSVKVTYIIFVRLTHLKNFIRIVVLFVAGVVCAPFSDAHHFCVYYAVPRAFAADMAEYHLSAHTQPATADIINYILLDIVTTTGRNEWNVCECSMHNSKALHHFCYFKILHCVVWLQKHSLAVYFSAMAIFSVLKRRISGQKSTR